MSCPVTPSYIGRESRTRSWLSIIVATAYYAFRRHQSTAGGESREEAGVVFPHDFSSSLNIYLLSPFMGGHKTIDDPPRLRICNYAVVLWTCAGVRARACESCERNKMKLTRQSAVRLGCCWFSAQRLKAPHSHYRLTSQQRAVDATSFPSDHLPLAAGKVLIDGSYPSYTPADEIRRRYRETRIHHSVDDACFPVVRSPLISTSPTSSVPICRVVCHS